MQLADSQSAVNTRKPRRRSRDGLLVQLLSPKPSFDILSVAHAQRKEVENYVALRFEDAYGANVQKFMPYLLSMRCLGKLSGVTGMRFAGDSQLFLEQYLEHPIEEQLTELYQQDIKRHAIVEIGNLVAIQGGASQIMFLLFTAILHAAGYKWIVFTATTPLLSTLSKLGFQSRKIKDADSARLPEEQLDDWGTYYQTAPMVVAGKLEDALRIIHDKPLYRKVMMTYQSVIEELVDELSENLTDDLLVKV